MLQCRNAIAAGECGQHEQCKLCCIRASIGKAFYKKASFKNLEASMKLLSEDETKVTPCDVSVSGTYLNIHGEDYMVLTVYDVTELKNAQRLLSIEREHSISADKLKSAFLANMSHEIRTPLNAIVGFSGLMVSASSEEERKMYADVIAENNERLLRLVNDIFDLSQIESGTVDFVYTEFDANDLLRELEYNGTNKAEKLFMDGLFSSFNRVDKIDLEDSYYKTINSIKSEVNSRENKEKLFYANSINKGRILWMLSILACLFAGFYPDRKSTRLNSSHSH